ncbi:MAG: hypothetical protein IAE77_18440 [Prosthecobacter sp.]|jgi:hypothetical protein|uniref:hypothetical protein n=1 Tax=Prosthecobacter sp. TaxID=1965333 RepID=UPI001A0744A6|nr:hypothetical protein [Prosthecobacter sp.]MBE2285446.1 hypothetical protein [Prosthecobacter sp.]
MFKILKTLSKSLGGSKPAAAPAPAAKPGSLLDKVNKGAPVAAAKPPPSPKTPEELCGITGKMPKEEIRAQLKLLFRRYNRTASSLDAKLRHEAETMLDAIVQVREKHFGEI